jgi:DNA mismatch endonuclease, patch repair protein
MDTISRERRSWNMSRIRSKNTRPELVVRSMLHADGYRFRLHVRHLPGHPDIVLPKWRTVVFVNGCFWHQHKGCAYAYTPKSRKAFWREKFPGNVTRDMEKARDLASLGWTVETVWECELADVEKLRKHLLRVMKRAARRVSPKCNTDSVTHFHQVGSFR